MQIVIFELANEDLKRCDVKESYTDLIAVFLYRKDIPGFIRLVFSLESPFCDHVADSSLQSLRLINGSCLSLSLLMLSLCFRLLNHGDFIAMIDKQVQIFVKNFLWKADMQLFLTAHPVQIE